MHSPRLRGASLTSGSSSATVSPRTALRRLSFSPAVRLRKFSKSACSRTNLSFTSCSGHNSVQSGVVRVAVGVRV